MPRQTKIVATLGPASSDATVLENMIKAGLNVVRVNFSHGTAAEHTERVLQVREIAQRLKCDIAVMADLQGPKIRIGKFASGFTELVKGASFILDANCPEGNDERVGLDYPELVEDVKTSDTLLLDDGKIVLQVLSVKGKEITTQVRVGGKLKDRKGINKLGGGLSAPALTSKDMED
ncbi:MAG: pyruvate kinase, partial [Limnobacter sp.]|nr:pyruvate kinase [Limnobacter sp.]